MSRATTRRSSIPVLDDASLASQTNVESDAQLVARVRGVRLRLRWVLEARARGSPDGVTEVRGVAPSEARCPIAAVARPWEFSVVYTMFRTVEDHLDHTDDFGSHLVSHSVVGGWIVGADGSLGGWIGEADGSVGRMDR